MASKNPTKVITGPRTKMSYLHVLEPASINGSNPKYSGSFLIPKDSPDVEKITKAIQAAYEDGQAKLKGSSKNAKTYYPDQVVTPYDFSNSLVDLDVVYEYNFWPYGTGRDYRGAKRLTPFVFAGLGMTYADVKTNGAKKGKVAFNLPLGLGLKYKIGERVNVGLEWSIHFAQNDELDGVKDPYHIKSSGLFKNTDCYSLLQVTLTYSFSPKCTTCNKEF